MKSFIICSFNRVFLVIKGLLTESGSGLYQVKLASIFLLVMVSACGPNKATREQSRKVLKAFDYELIQLTKRFSNTSAFEAIMIMRKLPGIQLPLISINDTIAGTNQQTFNLQRAKGIYLYHSNDSLPQKIANSDSLIVNFQNPKHPDKEYKLIVSAYKEKLTNLNMVFPEIMDASIYMNNIQIGDIHMNAEFKHGVPEEAMLTLNAGGLKVSVQMETTFGRKKSKIDFKFDLHDSEQSLIKARIQSYVTTTNANSMAYDGKSIDLEIFPLKLEMESDYPFSENSPGNFFENFNKQSHIRLSDIHGNSLGNLKLEQTKGRSRVNLIMYYHDNSSENLEDFMLSVKKILNMKTSMPH